MELGWDVASTAEDAPATAAESDEDLAEDVQLVLRPWPSCCEKDQVVSVVLTLQDAGSVQDLERLTRLLLRAPRRPELLRVLLPSEARAHELGARFRGELRPAGLRHRVRDRCLLIAADADAVDGSHTLLAQHPALAPFVNSIVLLRTPQCFGVWDTFARLGLPAAASPAAGAAAVQQLGAQLAAALDPLLPGQGPVTRQLILAAEPGGRRPRLYHGAHPAARTQPLATWPEVCAAVGLPVFEAPPRLLAGGWFDRA